MKQKTKFSIVVSDYTDTKFLENKNPISVLSVYSRVRNKNRETVPHFVEWCGTPPRRTT